MLGIAIGIAAVIAMVSLGQGAHQAVVNELESMGNNLLYVEAGNRVVQGVSTARDSMTYENVVAVRKDCPAVAMASPHVNFRSQVITDGRNWNTQIRGIDPEFQRIRNWPVVEGIFLPPSSMTSAA